MTDVKAGPQPAAIPPPDRSQLERLNSLYRIIDKAPAGGGLRARLASGARRLFGRVLSRQQEFNAVIVDHINRNMAVGFEAHQASINTIEWVESNIDGYEDARDEIQRHLEALLARERRNDAAVRALAAQHDELRAALGVVQQAAHTLKREIATLSSENPKSHDASPESRIPNPGLNSQFDDLDSHKYVGFEDQFRGSPDEIRRRVQQYLPIFDKASDVLDVGCGRGEFLELLHNHGVRARGIDINPAMVDVSRGKGLQAETSDALAYLRGLPDSSLGGLFAAQVVEHLEPRYLMRLLDAAFDKLRPGAPIVLETINPACWFAFFESYIRDLTHVRPVHPDTLKYLLIATGFQRVDIAYRAPYPETDKLQPLPRGSGAPTSLDDMIETLNANVEKINRLLFTYLDYAAIGIRA
jgi:2-polyprenyl-3-methyl-5-hydroxy-6-metoxy-1,4-benzoquinol methylase/prefoldin subunit 5